MCYPSLAPVYKINPRTKHLNISQIIHTTSRGHYLIQELHTGPLPDLLHYCSQFLIGLLQVPCTHKQETSSKKYFHSCKQHHCSTCQLSKLQHKCVCIIGEDIVSHLIMNLILLVALLYAVSHLDTDTFNSWL